MSPVDMPGRSARKPARRESNRSRRPEGTGSTATTTRLPAPIGSDTTSLAMTGATSVRFRRAILNGEAIGRGDQGAMYWSYVRR
jgi:hypothetical protein